jgi:hypothetical protein
LMKFLGTEVGGSGAGAAGDGGSTKRPRGEQPSSDRLSKRCRRVTTTPAPVDESGKAVVTAKSGAVNVNTSDVDRDTIEWHCGKCTALNPGSSTRCHICLGYRARQSAVSSRAKDSNSVEQRPVDRQKVDKRKYTTKQDGSSRRQTSSSFKPTGDSKPISSSSSSNDSKATKGIKQLPKPTVRRTSTSSGSSSKASETIKGTKQLSKPTVRKKSTSSGSSSKISKATKGTKDLSKPIVRKKSTSSGRSSKISKATKGASELRLGDTVPYEVLSAFEEWTESGVQPSTHRAYVKHAHKVFEHGVKQYGLKQGSTVQEAHTQLRGSSMDPGGFLKASLTSLMKFLGTEVGGSGAGAAGDGGSTKRPRGEQPSNDRLSKKRQAKAGKVEKLKTKSPGPKKVMTKSVTMSKRDVQGQSASGGRKPTKMRRFKVKRTDSDRSVEPSSGIGSESEGENESFDDSRIMQRSRSVQEGALDLLGMVQALNRDTPDGTAGAGASADGDLVDEAVNAAKSTGAAVWQEKDERQANVTYSEYTTTNVTNKTQVLARTNSQQVLVDGLLSMHAVPLNAVNATKTTGNGTRAEEQGGEPADAVQPESSICLRKPSLAALAAKANPNTREKSVSIGDAAQQMSAAPARDGLTAWT